MKSPGDQLGYPLLLDAARVGTTLSLFQWQDQCALSQTEGCWSVQKRQAESMTDLPLDGLHQAFCPEANHQVVP